MRLLSICNKLLPDGACFKFDLFKIMHQYALDKFAEDHRKEENSSCVFLIR